MRDRLALIREQKFAINHGEHYADVGAVGAPIIKRGRRVEYGVSLAYPQHLVTEGRLDRAEVVARVQQIAREIGERIG